MLEYILGRETMPPDLLSQIRLVDIGAVESLWEPNSKQVKLLRSGMRRGGKFIYTDCGDEEAVEHATELLRALVSELIVVGLDLLVEIGVSRMLPQIDFFARVHGAGVVITRVATTMEKPDGIHRTRYLLTRLAALGVPTVLALGRPTQPEVAFTAFECFDGTEVVCAIPDASERKAMWERALRGIPNGPRLAERVAPLPMRRVALRAAIRLAERYARLRGHTRRRITQVDIEQAWQTIVGQTLSRLGERVKTRGNWDDLVLDEEASQVIEEIRAFATHRTRIMTEWGFDNKIPYGRGLTMLFGGPSGTGKTFAAGLLSQEMGVVLYKIDISRVMSKWVGETEKHLAKLFDEAQAHKVAMLFDEADALFGARTEVRTSSDRYANLETNFLLQKMEEFDGMVILTTNHKKLIDPAFSRRIRYHVNFNEPDAELREILWRKLIPSEMPVADDVDFEALAYFYEVNGGNIRNIVLRAAVFAAQEGTGLTYAILDKAAAIEYRALGRLVPTDDLDI
jgi:AAA+ superfamily predicted ATPase